MWIHNRKEEEVAKDLCVFFNQESIMVTYAPVEVHCLSDDKGGM